MKKFLSIALAAMMAFTLVSCKPAVPVAPASPAASTTTDGETQKPADFKIGIITGTVSQGEEEFRAAEAMKAKYGDMIITTTYPDNFTQETETIISNTKALADAGAKAIVFCQAVPGASAAIDKVREQYPDILFVCGVPGEDPGVIASKADVVLAADELGMGTTIIDEAVKMGAKTFVHYSFPRHMSYAMLSARRDLLKQTAEARGLVFVDATAPDPTSDAGVAGAQQFILEDVPRMVEKYGKDTAFFSTNCSMQEPLIKKVLELGALLPQQCCPSPYHAYPGALGIEIPEDKKGDINYAVEQIKGKIAEKGGTGRFATWPVPINMLLVEAGVEYSKAYLEGKLADKNDQAKLTEIVDTIVGKGKTTMKSYSGKNDKGEEEAFANYYMILSDYIEF